MNGKYIQLDPDFGNSLVRQKCVAKIEFCQNPTKYPGCQNKDLTVLKN